LGNVVVGLANEYSSEDSSLKNNILTVTSIIGSNIIDAESPLDFSSNDFILSVMDDFDTTIENVSDTFSDVNPVTLSDQILTKANSIDPILSTDFSDVTYTWYRNGSEILDAYEKSYTVTIDDVEQSLTVSAEYIDLDGTREIVWSNPLIIVSIEDIDAALNLISEGSAVGSEVGITAYGGEGASYRLKDDANGRFAIDASGVVTVANGFGLDYELAQSHDIVVEATASDGVTKSEKTFTINVTDNADGPVIFYEISNDGSELVLGARVNPAYDVVNPNFVSFADTPLLDPYPGLEDFTFFIDYDTSVLETKKGGFLGNIVEKDAMDLYSMSLSEEVAGTLRVGGVTNVSEGVAPIDIANDQTVFSITFNILDSDAPLGFRTYNHSLDGTPNTDPVFSKVSNTTFEKTSAIVDGTISVLQGHDVLGDAKMYLADITATEGVYIRATSLGETSEFEIVVDHTVAVDEISFTLGTTASITNFSSSVSGLSPTLDTSVANTATFSLGNAGSVLSANTEHVLATFEAGGMGAFTLTNVLMSESGAASATGLQDVSVVLSSSSLGAGGIFNVEVSGSDAQLTLGNLNYDSTMEAGLNYPLAAADALDALKMAVGLKPSAASGRDISVAEYIAADVNGDGAVFANDALNILKAAVGLGLGTSNGPSFVIIDEDADYSTLNEQNVDYDPIITLNDIQDDHTLDISLILLGDVNGF